jgi:hypothetical protein
MFGLRNVKSNKLACCLEYSIWDLLILEFGVYWGVKIAL